MTITEVKARVDQLGSAWEQFKQVNDRRLAEIENKGSSDPLTQEHLARINDKLDEYQQRVTKMEVATKRPSADNGDCKASDDLVQAHKQAFRNYLRKGVEGDLCNLETKALSVSSDPDGGYLVSPQISNNITKTIFETSPIRQLASVETISSEALEILEDRDEASAGWTTETAEIEETETPTLGKKSISVYELYAQPKATQKLIDDAAIDIESWLAEKVAAIFARKENNAFIIGDGVGKPRGILTYDDGTDWEEIEQMTSGLNGLVTADKIVELYFKLKEDYTSSASFLMNRSMIVEIRKLKDSTNQYLWSPGLSSGASDTLMGVPLHQAADMPLPASNSLSIAFGDFRSAYQIVDRTGIRVLRDPFTEKPFVKFYSTKRVGGDVVNFEAIKLMRLTN